MRVSRLPLLFSTSNGYTENSEDYWKNEIPYLRSVESPWDKQISPKYKTTITMPRSEFIGKLGLTDGAVPVSAGGDGELLLKVLSYTQGHRIESVRVGGKKFTGREVREAGASFEPIHPSYERQRD